MPNQAVELIETLATEASEIDITPSSSLLQRIKNSMKTQDIWASSVDEAFQSLAAEMSGEANVR